MSDIPKIITYGIHEGKYLCGQYCCLNNYGPQSGKIHFDEYPSCCCKLKSPDIIDFGNGTWGCTNERYNNEINLNDINLNDMYFNEIDMED